MKFWIGVASREHVLRGVVGGFCQLCHGREQPLRRMGVGDWIVYYSSKEKFDQPAPCQQFTAIGKVIGANVYEYPMSPVFVPYRRDVRFKDCNSIDIRPLIPRLDFIRDKRHWGAAFRFGHLEISVDDFKIIATEMLGFEPSIRTRQHEAA